MDIKDDRLVIEEKGIYSIENFLSARRLMYWQVYLHKTTVSAEKMMISLINRAKYVVQQGQHLLATDELRFFLTSNYTLNDFETNDSSLENFLVLDDFDIWGAIKLWKNHEDYILKNLSRMFLDRNLFKITLRNEEFSFSDIEEEKIRLRKRLPIPPSDLSYFFNHGVLSNHAYINTEQIFILTKKGNIIDVALAADLPNIKAMSKIVKKHYICQAKNLTL
jgi:uncharacterized protein